MVKIQTKNCVNKLSSFDIFDTLVTRRVATPDGIFAIMQKKISSNTNIPEILRNNFYIIRKESEKFARKFAQNNYGTFEISFDDIYSVIKNNFDLPDSDVDFLKNLEITTEIENLLPITKNINFVKELIKNNENVVLISDMYYDAKNLRHILSHIDTIFSGIKIYVSSEYKTSKAEAKLFEIVKNQENADFDNWCHYGDNKLSDIKKPASLGIKTKYLKQEDLMPYERYLLDGNLSNSAYQLTVGSAKLARMFKPQTKAQTYVLGCSFAAPILFNYVDWIISQALKRGFKTLYFIARDGYIPKIIADKIIEKRQLNIKTKYLYGSRYAWRVVNEKNFDTVIDFIFQEYTDNISAELISYRLGISCAKLCEILQISSPSKRINNKLKKILSERIKQAEIKNKIIDANRDRKNMLLDYFRQEIDFSENTIAFVDLHGTGRTQDIIASLIEEIKKTDIFSFYLINTQMEQNRHSRKSSYILDVGYMSYWIELLCRTLNGQTLGYEKSNEIIKPVLEKINPEPIIKWGFEEYLEGIKNYTDIILRNNSAINYNDLNIYNKYSDYLFTSLDKTTADVMGDIPYLPIGNEKNISFAAKRYSLIEVVMDYLLCNGNSKSIFPFISQARSSKLSKNFQKFAEKYPTPQKFLLNIYVNKKKKKAYITILGIKVSFYKLLQKTLRFANIVKNHR